MTATAKPEVANPPENGSALYGVMAEFDRPDALVRSVEAARQAGLPVYATRPGRRTIPGGP